MIAAIFGLVFLLALIGAFAAVGTAMKHRRERLELALEPTCLLCDSRDVTLGMPPEYRCRTCGFDTHKAGALTNELERYRELSYARDELAVTLRVLEEATEANRIGRIPEAAEPLSRALNHLRDVVLDELKLLESPHPRASEDEVAKVRSYLELVKRVRDEARHDILAQMSADGAVERPVKLDFEHVVARDYEEL